MRTWRRLWVILHRERFQLLRFETLNGVVVKIDVRDLHLTGEALFLHGEAVVLYGDFNFPVVSSRTG